MTPVELIAALEAARAEGYAAGYEAGQREMKVEAAHVATLNMIAPIKIVAAILALPINPPPAEAGKEKDDAS